jgi:hypothetical protein
MDPFGWRKGLMARRIRRGVEIFGKTRKLFQDREGGIHQGAPSLPADGFPRYDLETGQSESPKEILLQNSLKIAAQVLQTEQVLPIADLAHRIVEELMMNPNHNLHQRWRYEKP